jgi:putative transposase
MPNYRRAFVPGGCWFFTVNLLDRRRRLLVDHIDSLRAAIVATRVKYPFRIDAWVVLPNHVHAVWTLPPDDADFSTRWRLIKAAFAKSLPNDEPAAALRKGRNERAIWQRRFWEHLIRNDVDYARHIEYCYINPVKHGLVARVRDWPHSSFHRDVARGIFPLDWARDVAATGEFGEAP